MPLLLQCRPFTTWHLYPSSQPSSVSSVHTRFAPFTVTYQGASERERRGNDRQRERGRELSEKYENMQIKLEDPRFSAAAAAAINIFERDDSGRRRRMSETSQQFFSLAREREREREREEEEEMEKIVGHR